MREHFCERHCAGIEAAGQVLSRRRVHNVLALIMILSFFGLQYFILMPVMASEVLHGNAQVLGALTAFVGLGSVSAALVMANRGTGEILLRAVGLAMLGFSVCEMIFSLSDNLVWSLISVMAIAFCMTLQLSGSHSYVQLTVPDRLRGKVMSIYMMIFMGMGPLGSLLAGWLSRQLGAPRTLSICATVCGATALVYILSRLRKAERV